MTHVADFSLSYDTVAYAIRVEGSLRPEIGDIEGERTSATLTRDETELTITVEAADLVALRAGLNTWLTLATVAERVGEIGGDGGTAGRPVS